MILQMAPALLAPRLDGNPSFPRRILQRFLQHELSWPLQMGTNASHKLPEDWENQCEKAFFRLVYVINREKIHLTLWINADHT